MSSPQYLTGVVWSAVNAGATVLVPFGIFIFFARVAGPEVIGVVALAVACADVLKTLGMQGVYEALLPEAQTDIRHHQTALAVLLLGGCGTLLLYLAVLAGLALFQPAVHAHLVALALVGLRIPLDLATLQPQAALAQRLSYRRLAMRTLVASVIAGVIGAVTTMVTRPLYGLIAYQILLSALTLLITVLGTDLLVRPRLHMDCYRRMAREAWWSTSVRFVAANVANLDQIIVAAVAGSTPLAYFNLGKRIETSFVSVAGSFTSIMFQPLFAKHESVPPATVMRRSLAVLTVVCGVPAACFLAQSELLVRILFGARWLAAAPVTAVLALSGCIKAVGCVPGALLSVTGRNRQLFSVAIASAVGTAAAALFLTPFGIVWCALGLLIKNLLSVAWLAAGQRDLVPAPMRLYVSASIVPFGLVLAGVCALAFVPVHAAGLAGMIEGLVWLAAGAGLGVAAAGLYLAWYLPLNVGTLFATVRRRLRVA